MTEQSTLLTKSKINRLCYKFSSIFAKNGQSSLALVLVLVLESKALYYNDDEEGNEIGNC